MKYEQGPKPKERNENPANMAYKAELERLDTEVAREQAKIDEYHNTLKQKKGCDKCSVS